MTTSPIIFAEPRQIKPRQRKELEAAGYLVVIVPDVSKIKTAGELPTAPEDDGFNLEEAS